MGHMIGDAGDVGKCPAWWIPGGQMTEDRVGYRRALHLAHSTTGMRLAVSTSVHRYRFLLASVIALLALVIGCAATMAQADFDQAVAAFEAGDYKAAITRLEASTRRGRESARDRILLGWCYLKLGDLDRARTELERGLALGPRDPNAYYAYEGLGWIAYRTGDQNRALAAFNESLRLTPGYHNAHDGLGWVYLARRDPVRAEANFMAALKLAPTDRDARRGLAFVAYHRGDWAVAIERFQALLQEQDGDSLTRSALGWAYYYKNDYAAARRVFQDVARREPSWADPLAGLGWAAERQGRRDEAKTWFRAAISKSAVYVATSDPAASLRKLFVGEPEWLDIWRELGWGLFHQQAPTLAESEFRALLQRHPADPDGLRGLGFTLYALRRYREAIPPLEQVLASGANLPPVKERVEIPGAPGLHPITSDAMSTLAWSYYQAGDVAQALKYFRDVTTRQPDWPDAWSGLGWTLTKGGDRIEAERSFRRSLAAQPGYADAVRGLQELGKRP
jgi:tetratricopeptide (TPR) repeat protein